MRGGIALAGAGAPGPPDVAKRLGRRPRLRAGGGSPARRPCSAAPPGPRRPPRARGTRRREPPPLRRGTGRAARCGRLRPTWLRHAPRGRRCRSRACPRRRRVVVTCSRSACGSSSTGANEPEARSLSAEAASFSRRSPFGVITTSGRALGSSAWRRSRWKYCAEVVALTMRMFSCAASWRNRSSLALECSGPLPS